MLGTITIRNTLHPQDERVIVECRYKKLRSFRIVEDEHTAKCIAMAEVQSEVQMKVAGLIEEKDV